jgi:catechol 2,3-dioxygenase-like lactoylglutathione lyase family enzyme
LPQSAALRFGAGVSAGGKGGVRVADRSEAERGTPRIYDLIEHVPKESEGKSPSIWAWPQVVDMFRDTKAFSGFSVDNLAKARDFYGDILGLDVKQDDMGLTLHLGTGADVFVYPKGDQHQPASFTILNFLVDDIDKAVEDLKAKGIEFEHIEMQVPMGVGGDTVTIKTEPSGIIHSDAPEHGPHIAWFKDPAGNTLAVLQEVKG